MSSLFEKILSTPIAVLPLSSIIEEKEPLTIGSRRQKNIANVFRGSLAIRQVDAGSSNACEQEITALANPYYDIERFGIHFVASPRHADLLLVTGPVTRNMRDALRATYEAMPTPNLVVAVGDEAIDGGLFKDSYAVVGGVDSVIPVDYLIPGSPPSPKRILAALLTILGVIKTRIKQ